MRISVLILLAASASAQNAPDLRPGSTADLQTLARTVRTLQTSAHKDAADKLIAESAQLQTTGQLGEARRRLLNALSVLNGQAWDSKAEFLWSLKLRADKTVIDPAFPITVRLTQLYSAGYQSKDALKLKAAVTDEAGKTVKELGEHEIDSRDLLDQPAALEVSLDGLKDGAYRLSADVMENGTALAHLDQALSVISGIESQRVSVEHRLSKITGHESAKATVRWPYDMARVVNLGIRQLNSNDFGLREDKTQTFDFIKEIRESQETLKALEAGKDPLVRAKGDHERHYWFAEAGEIMPYRVYVPSKWDGKSSLKMMFVLHGNTRDHDFYFDRDNGLLPKLAEQNGWLVVCPMGYRPSAGYNAASLASLTGGTPRPRQRQTELSEKDAMNVFDLVTKEYPVDPAKVYLFGHSAGATGGWYIAAKYPEKFAGIALSAFGTRPETYPFDRVKGKPIMVIIGTKDAPNTVATARLMAKTLEEKGIERNFFEVEGATHETIVGIAEPKVFEFFENHLHHK